MYLKTNTLQAYVVPVEVLKVSYPIKQVLFLFPFHIKREEDSGRVRNLPKFTEQVRTRWDGTGVLLTPDDWLWSIVYDEWATKVVQDQSCLYRRANSKSTCLIDSFSLLNCKRWGLRDSLLVLLQHDFFCACNIFSWVSRKTVKIYYVVYWILR